MTPGNLLPERRNILAAHPKIAFIGAGSTVFMKNIVGDVLQRPALAGARIALMDINPQRLEESAVVARKLAATLSAPAMVETFTDQRKALEGADFVVVAFQIGGYEPCTVTDFEVPKKYGLRQTIADTLGVGGIMRGLRTVPHLWRICEDMLAVCPDAILLQYVNPMAINTWAIAEKYPAIRQVGLCHSVQGTAEELARDLDLAIDRIRYRAAGINHMAFYLKFEEVMEDGSLRDLYPDLVRAYREGRAPKPNRHNPRCPNKVRYEMLARLGYFVTESSEHFAEYTPWFIKRDRPDLIEKFGIPLDEYPKRCVAQIDRWKNQAAEYRKADTIEVKPSREYASAIMNAVWTGDPAVIYGNVRNAGHITSLPDGCAVEVPCLVDRNGIQPTYVGTLPPQLTALIRTNINVQELTVAALLEENREHIYHAAMMDPHAGAELDLEQIWNLVDDLLDAHGEWLPAWARGSRQQRVA
ncbi:alpha-glucosidase/alpha-galactosidase [soil metagenome]